MNSNRYFSISEAAQKLGVSISTLRRWEREGKISIGRTPGGKRLFSEQDLDLLSSPIKTQLGKKSIHFKIPPFKLPPRLSILTLLLIIAVVSNFYLLSLTPLPQKAVLGVQTFLAPALSESAPLGNILSKVNNFFKTKVAVLFLVKSEPDEDLLIRVEALEKSIKALDKPTELTSEPISDSLTLSSLTTTTLLATTINGNTLTGTRLIFSGDAPSIYPSTTNSKISLNAAGTGAINIGDSSTGDIYLAGGSTKTGCTITNSSGSLNCSSDITSQGNLIAEDLYANGGDILTDKTTLNLGGSSTSIAIPGSLTVTGAVNLSSTLSLSDGTASAPSLTFKDDANTGLFRATTDVLALTTAGTERLRIDSSGNVGIGTTSPTAKLQVSGELDVTGNRIYLSKASNNTGILYGGGDTGQVLLYGASTLSATFGANSIAFVPSVSIGTNPASAGTIRLPNATSIQWRNSGNTANDVYILGDQGANLEFHADNASGGIKFSVAGSFRWTMTNDGSLLGPGTVATTGTIRLPHQATIYARNSANNLDTKLIKGSTLGAGDGVEVGDPSYRTDIVGAEVHFNNVGTTASSANAFLNSGDTNNLLRSTSSLRYKNLIGNLSLNDAQNIILNAEPIVYTSKASSDDPNTEFIGLAAEQIADLDKRFATFTPDGLPDWVQYPALTAPLALVVQDHELRIAALESSSSTVLSETSLDVETATVSATLNVLGKTTTNDLGITGKITSGLLAIDGLSGSINSLGEFKIQDLGLGSINFLNGKVTIDTTGNLKTQSLETDRLKIGANSAGTATLPANLTSLDIESEAATESSKVLITPRTLTDKTLTVTNVQNGKFTVGIQNPNTSDISFFWFIIN